MATTYNSRFLAIGSGEPNISAGWSIRVLDYKDMTSLITVITDFSAMSFTQELNGPGTGSITMDEQAPFWSDILANGLSKRAIKKNVYVFEAWDNGVPRFAWLGQVVEDAPIGEDETQTVTISGPGIAQVLGWAKVWRPGWPTPVPIIGYQPTKATTNPTVIPLYRETSYTDTLAAFQWQFPVAWSTMRMWYTLFRAAQRRGLLPFVKPMFSYLADSGKQPWLTVNTVSTVVDKEGYQPAEPDQSLLEFLADATGQDYSKWFGQRLEWMMYPGFKLDVRRLIGADRSSTVRFFTGNILSESRTRDREAIWNRIVAQDVDNIESVRMDKASVARWNLREQWNTANKQITINKIRDRIADNLIAGSKDEKDEWTIGIPYDDPGRVPYRNFFVGDYIGITSDVVGLTPDGTHPPEKYRVMAITVSVTADSTMPECELTLKSMISTKLDEMQRQLTDLINNPKNQDLSGLTDVNLTKPVADGSTLTWDASKGTWVAGDAAGSGRTYVSATAPTTANPGDFWLETYD